MFEVVRYRGGPRRGKSFRYRHKKCPTCVWVWRKPENAERWLYRLPEVVAAVAAGVRVVWAEGEKDADACAAAGWAATSHHGGAGKATPEQAQWFRGHTGFVNLLLDNDDDSTSGSYRAGAACAWERYRLLHSAAVGLRASQIRFYRAAEGKDAADHLASGESLTALIRVPTRQVREWATERVEFLSANAKTSMHGSDWTKYAKEKEH
jgi:DNA primase